MNAREFYEKVKTMRKWQKNYFSTHSRQALEESKKLEQIIDAEIERVEKLMWDRSNPGLFNKQENYE